MKVKDLISFRLWGDYALYKKPWCNREQQSFLIPTKTALIGMIGGILGFGKEDYLHKLPPEEVMVGIQLRKKISKELQGYNLMQSAGLHSRTRNFSNPYRNPPAKGSRSPTRLEMLKNPDYNIFIHLKDQDLFDQLWIYLSEGKCVFPPFLGQANLFANISEVRKKRLKPKEISSVQTVAPAEMVEPLKMMGKIHSERIPVKMKTDRSAPEFLSIVFKNEKDASISIKYSKDFIFGETDDGDRLSLF